jgi:hypothetical protein
MPLLYTIQNQIEILEMVAEPSSEMHHNWPMALDPTVNPENTIDNTNNEDLTMREYTIKFEKWIEKTKIAVEISGQFCDLDPVRLDWIIRTSIRERYPPPQHSLPPHPPPLAYTYPSPPQPLQPQSPFPHHSSKTKSSPYLSLPAQSPVWAPVQKSPIKDLCPIWGAQKCPVEFTEDQKDETQGEEGDGGENESPNPKSQLVSEAELKLNSISVSSKLSIPRNTPQLEAQVKEINNPPMYTPPTLFQPKTSAASAAATRGRRGSGVIRGMIERDIKAPEKNGKRSSTYHKIPIQYASNLNHARYLPNGPKNPGDWSYIPVSMLSQYRNFKNSSWASIGMGRLCAEEIDPLFRDIEFPQYGAGYFEGEDKEGREESARGNLESKGKEKAKNEDGFQKGKEETGEVEEVKL